MRYLPREVEWPIWYAPCVIQVQRCLLELYMCFLQPSPSPSLEGGDSWQAPGKKDHPLPPLEMRHMCMAASMCVVLVSSMCCVVCLVCCNIHFTSSSLDVQFYFYSLPPPPLLAVELASAYSTSVQCYPHAAHIGACQGGSSKRGMLSIYIHHCWLGPHLLHNHSTHPTSQHIPPHLISLTRTPSPLTTPQAPGSSSDRTSLTRWPLDDDGYHWN